MNYSTDYKNYRTRNHVLIPTDVPGVHRCRHCPLEVGFLIGREDNGSLIHHQIEKAGDCSFEFLKLKPTPERQEFYKKALLALMDIRADVLNFLSTKKSELPARELAILGIVEESMVEDMGRLLKLSDGSRS